nr:MAG TPA: hypothetical protein [Caudoviricetes sp.]
MLEFNFSILIFNKYSIICKFIYLPQYRRGLKL